MRKRITGRILLLFFIMIGIDMQMKAQVFFSNEDVVPFCTEENDLAISFPAGTSGEEAFDFSSGCLGSTLSPQWFIMQIDEPGMLGITMEHSEGYDVDFACYGPFKGKNKQEVINSINEDITIYNVEDDLSIFDVYSPSDTCYTQSYLDEYNRVMDLEDSIYNDCSSRFFLLNYFDFNSDQEYEEYCEAEYENLMECIDETAQKEHAIYPPDPVQFDITNPCFRGYNDNYPLESIVDCSYSTSSKEFCYIPDAKTGEWYLFLVTNYSQKPGTISFDKTSGSATTNCKIIVDAMTVGPVCEGESFELDVNNAPENATFLWTGPNGFVSTEKNPTISNVTQENAGIYTVVMVSNGVSSDEVEVPVVVNKRHVVDITKEIKEGESYIFGDEILTTTGEYQKTFTSEVTGCDSIVNLSLTVLKYDPVVVSSNSPVCEGNAISFEVLKSPEDATFLWTGPNGFTSDQKEPVINMTTSDNAGLYSLVATVNGYELPVVETEVVVTEKTRVEIDSTIRQGETISFNGQQISVPGTYQDTLVSSATGCDSIVTLKLIVEEIVSAIASNNSPLCEGESLSLYIDDAPEGVSYEWTGPNKFKSTEQNPTIDGVTKSNSGIYSVKYEYKGKSFSLTTPVVINSAKKQHVKAVIKGDETYKIGDAEYSEAGEYTVTLVSATNCDSIVYLTLTRAYESKADLIPEMVFTPNSDGENDRWIIKNVELYSDITVTIYDRMGKIVREFNAYDNQENSWDGKDYRGRILPSTDYWYVIDVVESDKQYVGHVTLLH
ncbi:MAG: T9SS type B sorting domain-containing protein [Paludibacteraceae bacterium]|nr:T9SS type B sorting domain-containing protein [Paludibacteraceae bacterium]